jgi:hypothetical protein
MNSLKYGAILFFPFSLVETEQSKTKSHLAIDGGFYVSLTYICYA